MRFIKYTYLFYGLYEPHVRYNLIYAIFVVE